MGDAHETAGLIDTNKKGGPGSRRDPPDLFPVEDIEEA